MIQRIQTIFLLLATVSAVLGITLNLVSFDNIPLVNSGKTIIDLTKDAPQNIALDPIYILSGLLLSGCLSLVAIFMFKKRSMQAKLTSASFILGLLTFVFIQINFSISLTGIEKKIIHLGIASYMPIAIVVFNYLAIRYIKKDEELVRSADRMR